MSAVKTALSKGDSLFAPSLLSTMAWCQGLHKSSTVQSQWQTWAFRHLVQTDTGQTGPGIHRGAFEEHLSRVLWSGLYCPPKSRPLQINAMPRNLPIQLRASLHRFPHCGRVMACVITGQERQSKSCASQRWQISKIGSLNLLEISSHVSSNTVQHQRNPAQSSW